VTSPNEHAERPEPGAVLRIENLGVSFPGAARDRMHAVDGVSITLRAGRTTAVVGESGSGKSMTALAAMGLLPTGARVDSGRILLAEGEREVDVLGMNPREMRARRGRDMAMIFQEPMTSLNPVFSVGEQIVEAVRLHQQVSARAARDIAAAALAEVGIDRAADRLNQYPHEFSGGMRQRVMIAMATVCRPRVLFADEPTTALDVTVQAAVLDVIAALRESRGLAVMLISHDLGLVSRRADDVYVMYAGRVVEHAPAASLFASPLHPYTRSLLRCLPRKGSFGTRLVTVKELLGEESAFAPVAGGRPWWPGMPGAAHAELRDAGGGHAVAVCAEPIGA